MDEKSWHLKQALLRRQTNVRKETKLFREYARQAFEDTLTLYLHGTCCDIDVETGPRQMPSRYLRRRLELLISLYPPPEGYAVLPEQLKAALEQVRTISARIFCRHFLPALSDLAGRTHAGRAPRFAPAGSQQVARVLRTSRAARRYSGRALADRRRGSCHRGRGSARSSCSRDLLANRDRPVARIAHQQQRRHRAQRVAQPADAALLFGGRELRASAPGTPPENAARTTVVCISCSGIESLPAPTFSMV